MSFLSRLTPEQDFTGSIHPRQGFSCDDAGNDDEGEDGDSEGQPKTAAMSDRLAQRLSAHRTAALQIEIARHPQVALAALVHGMVQTVLQGRYYGHDLPLGVRLTVQDRLEGMAPDWPESPAAVALRELQQVAGEALPRTAPNCSPRCWRIRKTNWCDCWRYAWP